MAIIPVTARSRYSTVARRPLLLLLGLMYLIGASAARSPLALAAAVLVVGLWLFRLMLIVRREHC